VPIVSDAHRILAHMTTDTTARYASQRPWDAHAPVGFDLETTSADPGTARVVTAAIIDTAPGGRLHEWLVDPGVDIPPAAAAIHGITTAQARQGFDARTALGEIAATLGAYWAEGRTVAIYNAQYDLTVMRAELRRQGLPALQLGPVVDPLVLWRVVEPYRRGPKTLQAAAGRFSIDAGTAHSATADAAAAARLVAPLAALAGLRGLPTTDLMQRQTDWHRAWAHGFAEWLASQGGDASDVHDEWPRRVA
jgi:DNA polymerase-3 subunit epsilon